MIKGGGLHTGNGKPCYGKIMTDDTKEKIKQALTGVTLKESVKINMSKAHTVNMNKGKLPPRRLYDLPKYIYHVKSENKEGYEIRNHPKLKQKQFVATTISLEDNLERAKKYLEDINNPDNQKEIKTVVKYDNLPRYIRQINSEKFEGFEIKFHPTLKNKKWTRMNLTMDEKLQLAKNYLKEKKGEGSETK
jgi:hypothetical protein